MDQHINSVLINACLGNDSEFDDTQDESKDGKF